MSDDSVDGGGEARDHPQERLARLVNLLADGLDELGHLGPIPRAGAAEQLATVAREVIGGLAAVRREAFREARADGLTLTQIADQLGVSVQAVSQVLRKRPDD
ncbi:sigma factor-like helix-turn-helix DNA-binding protein [Actinomadura sp. WMMB 499]|uniref:sigma factor-like helix-turn-helix DNA-binding protein n=1 Tax=Actinomadura sp. WMMB 499 TaxID=1219491 RepID=UPI00124779AE|nr:sigma factor-like helix-turn-helix DNA-binding protein [Actinomadura sp. WMMB 499]QFG22838.1 sigma-70 family RNA polymerase sigma factor [Actinomadura sp. WMMB 499]